jgi:hypothetical protein
VLDDEELVRALEKLVNRRAHRALDDLDEVLGIEAQAGSEVERSATALVVGGERDELEDPLHVRVVEPCFTEALGGLFADKPLGAGAGVDARSLHADDAPSVGLRRGRNPDQRHELLGAERRDRRQPLDWIPGRDLDLGAKRLLALDDMPGDVLGEVLDEELSVDHHIVDRLLEELWEARHMDALLGGVEVDEAVDLRGHESIAVAVLHPDRFLDSGDARAGQADSDLGLGGLQIGRGGYSLVHAPTVAREQMPDDKRFVQLVTLACHDLRTPLATVSGFATTLANTGLEAPTDRYIGMIEAASAQLGELLDELTLLVRIESGRFDPKLDSLDSLELARAAAGELDEGRVDVSGTGSMVRVPEKEMTRGVSQLGRAASRHGGFDTVSLAVDGGMLRFSPLTRMSGAVLLGEELRDLGAVAATTLIRSLGGSVEVEGETLVVRLPS